MKSCPYPEEEKAVSLICAAIKALRNIRHRIECAAVQARRALYRTPTTPRCSNRELRFFEKLAGRRRSPFRIRTTSCPKPRSARMVEGAKLFLPKGDLIDLDKELERSPRKRKSLRAKSSGLKKRLPIRVCRESARRGCRGYPPEGEKYKEMYDKVLQLLRI
jgi:valyl-tRNA synthetase